MLKRVYVWNGSAWAAPEGDGEYAVRKFVYDGWRVIMELDGSNGDAVLREHTWGLDLSGSLEGAGGIGGLLGTHDTLGTAGSGDDRTFIYFYDANGNVGQVLETTAGANCGTVAAHYVYTPYGARLNAPAQNEYAQPFRFSTKWFDEETGLGYWGYRYYSPELGRWMSRDPIEEQGGVNLYEYVQSMPLTLSDPTGLKPPITCCSHEGCKWSGQVTITGWSLLIGGFSSARIDATAMDTTGCIYTVSGAGTKRLSGAVFGVGYFSTSGTFSGVDAPCRWPIAHGDSASVALLGFGASGSVPISINTAHFTVGKIQFFDWWEVGGANVYCAGGGFTVPLQTVQRVQSPLDDDCKESVG
ncbi:MAG TPA: RHS repeat-associated core domain-containing protein [Phycisphaerae bacterium]|nr:RHS repeat-associated core domain-containing protein [Phycisphaerae bacterium]HNU45118.1 RHS repeat-associated core domain-containing protein [Phycisphaerae bacterium]